MAEYTSRERSRRTPVRPTSRGIASLRRAASTGALALVLLAPASLTGQEEPGEIRGTVVDLQRDTPVGAAEVSIPALGRHTVADAEGRFRFRDVPPGSYSVRVGFLGYAATARDVEVPPGGTRSVEIRIAPGPVELEELTVTARSLTWLPGFRERRENRTGHFFTKREIEEADPSYLSQLLRDREGVKMGFNRSAHGASKRYPQFFYRGPGAGISCRPVVFVDGDMMGPGQPYWHFNEIPPERVLAMEVYYREQDLPESIDYDLRGQIPESGPEGFDGPRRLTGVDAASAGQRGVQEILDAADIDGIFQRRVPQRDENLSLSGTVLAGLYDRPPRIEHCGAIFVWTRLYPLADD